MAFQLINRSVWLSAILAAAVLFQNCAIKPAPPAEGGANSSSHSPPNFTFSKTPSVISAANQSIFEFSAPAPGISFDCSLNNAAYGPCTSPVTLTALPDGQYTLNVRGKNAVNNYYELTYSWTVDHTAPTVLITSSMAYSNSRAASVAFTGSAQGAPIVGFECKLDALAFAPCTSPFTVSNLTEGPHTVQIRGNDLAGNQSAPATLTWIVDVTAPQLSVTGAPPAGDTYDCAYGNINVAFNFTAADAGGSGIKNSMCRLDGGPEEACVSGKSYNISTFDGVTHTVTIRTLDNANNVSAVFTRSFRYLYYDCNPYDGGGGGG